MSARARPGTSQAPTRTESPEAPLPLPALATEAPRPAARVADLDFGPTEAEVLRARLDAVRVLVVRTSTELEALGQLLAAVPHPKDTRHEVPVALVAPLVEAINRGALDAVAASVGAAR